MSNLLAAVGRGQLSVLDSRVAKRRENFEFYRQALGDLPGISFMPEPANCRSTRWLTCIVVDPAEFGATREDIRLALEAENIEARPVWKPMHLQPVFRECRCYGGSVSRHNCSRTVCVCRVVRIWRTMIGIGVVDCCSVGLEVCWSHGNNADGTR